MKIYSPAAGMTKKIEEVNDEVFSQKMMGDGIAIVPEEEWIVSPVDGEVMAVFPTGHALGLKTEEGIELLLHLGVDTVELEGQHFNCVVTQGQKVKMGDPLVQMAHQKIKESGYENDVILMVIEARGKELEKPLSFGPVAIKDDLLTIR
ncbi:MAG: PTS sugar transporter subunit IIA [Enterococcus lemanii]|jgi:glucose-specific phosphotransferase system IIA component